jgi:sensor histidine kinase YesM
MGQAKYLSIRAKVFISYVIVQLLLICVVSATVYYFVGKRMTKQVISYSKQMTEQMAENMSKNLQTLEERVVYVLKDSNIFSYQDNIDLASKHDVSHRLKGLGVMLDSVHLPTHSLYLYDPFGCSFYYDKNGLSLEDFKSFDIYRYIKENKDELISHKGKTIWLALDEEADTLYMVKTVLDPEDCKYKGILCVEVGKEYLIDQCASIEKDLNNNIVIYDKENNLLTCGKGFINVAKAYLPNSGTTVKDYYVTEAKIKSKSWTLATFIASDVLDSAIHEFMRTFMLVEVAIIIIMGMITYGLSATMTGNITSIIKNFERIKIGEKAEDIIPRANDETTILCEKFNEMNRELNNYINKLAESTVLTERSELNALVAQMNPHFLYNTLESINSIAKLHGEDEISKCITKLARILRTSIYGENQEITLLDETTYIEQYLSLQNMIMGDRIDWVIEVDDTVKDALVPKLILQPIVENSIKYGLEEKLRDGFLCIIGSREGNNLIIKISDNGKGMSEETLSEILNNSRDYEKYHIGLNSVKRRLQILYGDEYGIDIESTLEEGTNVVLRMPYHI